MNQLVRRRKSLKLHRRSFFLWDILILRDFLGPWLWLNIWLLQWNIRLSSLGLGCHDRLLYANKCLRPPIVPTLVVHAET